MAGKILALVMLAVAAATEARADMRSYVWTYEYKTVPKGSVELENYFTMASDDLESPKGDMSSEHQVELEVGMNDRFDFAVYQVFSQEPGGSLVHDGFKFRSRYRFGEKGQWMMDPLLYLEYKGAGDLSGQAWEGKLILARDIGDLNIALNPVIEFEEEVEENGETEWETEWEYAAGASYRLHDLLRVGMEFKGSEAGHYLGPVISHGTPDLWVALGSAYRITAVEDGDDEFAIRLILGVGIK